MAMEKDDGRTTISSDICWPKFDFLDKDRSEAGKKICDKKKGVDVAYEID